MRGNEGQEMECSERTPRAQDGLCTICVDKYVPERSSYILGARVPEGAETGGVIRDTDALADHVQVPTHSVVTYLPTHNRPPLVFRL